MPASTVTLILRGLMVICVNENETECTVGILNSPPPLHFLKIIFRETPIGGPTTESELLQPQIKNNLRLDAENISQTKITFRDPNASINRQLEPTAANRTSFRWVVDLEHAELYGRRIGARRTAFNPILTFRKGELFTRMPSSNHLFTQRGLFFFEDFGFVASAVGVQLTLDQPPHSRIVFYNGGDAYDLSEPDTNYEVEIIHDAAIHSEVVTDANHYYKALGSGLSEAERILFMSRGEPGQPAGPEAACFIAFLSRSQLE